MLFQYITFNNLRTFCSCFNLLTQIGLKIICICNKNSDPMNICEIEECLPNVSIHISKLLVKMEFTFALVQFDFHSCCGYLSVLLRGSKSELLSAISIWISHDFWACCWSWDVHATLLGSFLSSIIIIVTLCIFLVLLQAEFASNFRLPIKSHNYLFDAVFFSVHTVPTPGIIPSSIPRFIPSPPFVSSLSSLPKLPIIGSLTIPL